MPPEPVKSCSTTDDLNRSRTVSSRVNVSLLLELRKRKWSSWEEMLECPVDWIEPYSNGTDKNGDKNGCNDEVDAIRNGDDESEDELFQKEMEVEECRTGDDTPVMTKLRRGVLDIGPTMSRLRSNTFSSCCLDRLVVMHCSCGEVVKREAYGTHHRMKHTQRSSAPCSPTTSNGSVPPSPLTLQPPPLSKLASTPCINKMTTPRSIQKKSSPKVVTPPKIHSNNNNEEKKPRRTPPSQVGAQDWKVLSSSDGGGTKLRIVRINPPGQSSTTPPSSKSSQETSEGSNEKNIVLPPPLAVSTVTPSPTGSEERLVSPRDRRAAHREEIRQTRPTVRARHRLSTPPVTVPKEEENRLSLPSSLGKSQHATTPYQPQPTTSYPTQSMHRPPDHHSSSSSSLHPPQSPLLISTSTAGGSRYTLHSPASSQMGVHPSHQRPSPSLAYTNEHGQKMYFMSRAPTQIKRPMSMQHQQQPMQHGEGMGYGGGGGGGAGPSTNPPSGQRQTIVIVLPPGARNRNGPIVLPPGTTLRAIPSGQSSSHHHGSTQSIQSGIGPNGQPVHYISHTPLPPSTRRIDMQGGSSMYPHHRLVPTQQHTPTSGAHSSHLHNHQQPQPSYHIHQQHQQQQQQQQQQQHHTISSSTVPSSYQYQMVHQGEGYHPGNHSDPMGVTRVVVGGQPMYGIQRAMNPGMQRVIEQRRLLHTPSPPPTLQPMPVLRAQLFEEGTTQNRAKKSVSPSMVSSSTVDSPSQQPSSSTGFKEERVGKSALMEILSQDDSSRDVISHEEVVSTGDGEEDEDEMMPVLECHSTFNEENEQMGREEEEMPETLEGCDSSTAFSTIPSSSTM